MSRLDPTNDGLEEEFHFNIFNYGDFLLPIVSF